MALSVRPSNGASNALAHLLPESSSSPISTAQRSCLHDRRCGDRSLHRSSGPFPDRPGRP